MPTNELLECPQAIRVIPALAEHRSLNMREFTFYGKMSDRKAREVREQMEKEWGLITISTPEDRTTSDVAIQLTKEGEEIARILSSIGPVLEQGKKRARSARRD